MSSLKLIPQFHAVNKGYKTLRARPLRAAFCLTAVSFAFLNVSGAHAATVTWTGTGADTLWSTGSNWSWSPSGSGVPTSSDDVTIGATFTSGNTITLSGTQGLNSLVFAPGTGSTTKQLSGGTLQIATGNITLQSGSTATGEITSAIDLGSGGTNQWVVDGSRLQLLTTSITVNGGSGSGSTITKTGTGTLALYGANQSYAGNWNITGDVFTGATEAFGTGKVSLNSVKWTVSLGTGGTGSYANDLSFTSGNIFLYLAGSNSTATLTGQLSGNATVYFNFNGGSSASGSTVVLNGSSAMTGGVFVVAQTVRLDKAGYLSNLSSVQVSRSNFAGTLNWNVAETVSAATTFNNRQSSTGFSTLGMLATGTTTINGQYNLNNSSTVGDGASLRLNVVSGSKLVLAGKVSDEKESSTVRSLDKTGAGTAVLSSDSNNYRGGTTVSAGTLLVNNASGSGTGSGAVAVSGGATLGGTGFIQPTGTNGITVGSGGFIAPGDAGIGTLSMNLGGTTGVASMASGASFKFELGTANASIGSIAAGSSDQLAVTGASTGDFVFNANNVDFQNTGAAGYYKIFSTDQGSADTWSGLTISATSGVVSAGLTYSGLADGLTGEFIVGTASNGGTVGDIYFHAVAIPEPSTWGLFVALSGLGLALGRRREKRS